MTLDDFTSPSLIVPRVHGREAASVLQELADALMREQRVPDGSKFLEAVLNREAIMGSDWEAGVAFPHARLAELKDLSFAVGRSEEPLAWGGKAVRAVRLVFLIAIPLHQSEQYLSLISGLARLSKAEQIVEKIHRADDAQQIFELLQQIKVQTEREQKPATKAVSATK